MKQFTISNLKKSFFKANVEYPILKNITFSIDKGDFLGVFGPSGSGKTTLLYCLSTLENISSGNVMFNGEVISNFLEEKKLEFRRNNIGFIFQFYHLLPNLTVYENILVAQSLVQEEDSDAILALLDRVGLMEYKDYYPNELSGGMQQRVSIARALINNPEVIFADEPTGNLDQKRGKEIMDLLKKISLENRVTIVMVTHNDDYKQYCSKIIQLVDGEIIDEA